jgi:hypothetical protein
MSPKEFQLNFCRDSITIHEDLKRYNYKWYRILDDHKEKIIKEFGYCNSIKLLFNNTFYLEDELKKLEENK